MTTNVILFGSGGLIKPTNHTPTDRPAILIRLNFHFRIRLHQPDESPSHPSELWTAGAQNRPSVCARCVYTHSEVRTTHVRTFTPYDECVRALPRCTSRGTFVSFQPVEPTIDISFRAKCRAFVPVRLEYLFLNLTRSRKNVVHLPNPVVDIAS